MRGESEDEWGVRVGMSEVGDERGWVMSQGVNR